MATNKSTEKEKGPEKVSNKGRSCKGTLYYSTALKSKAYNPICLGVPRTLPQVPDSVVVATEMEASKEDRHLADFRYACAGYSMYLDRIKEDPSQKNTLELPVCVGLELLVGKRIHKTSPAAAPVSTHVHHKEDAREVPQTQRHQPPTQSAGTVFLNKFSRNADLVASGVTKNVYKVGNYIKGSLSDFLFPFRGRSKFCGNRIRMAAATACKRVGQLGTNSGFGLSGFGGPAASKVAVSPSLECRHLDCRLTSQLVKSNGKRLFLVDTLALVRRLEGQGVPSKHAEAITAAITEVLNDSLENVSNSFVSKGEMQKTEMIQESNLSKFKSEIQSAQGHHFSLLQHETEKLRNDIEKMRSELRYEIDKVTAGQRLDLNLERGRIREELSNQNAETNNLTNKLDREIHALRAHVEAAKYDVIKYCIGTLVSISAVGLAVLRILL
ncbi:unnamed protein product [Prunus brigantina]